VKGRAGTEPPLRELVARGRCAVVVMELQRGVVGDLACIPELGKAVAEAGVITQTARLLHAARAAGVRVIHCTAAFRRDRAGSPGNVPLVNACSESRSSRRGHPAVEVVRAWPTGPLSASTACPLHGHVLIRGCVKGPA
jgi:nicotinamidase-related amidase